MRDTLLSVSFLLAPGLLPASAVTIHVPGDYPTIWQAIDCPATTTFAV